MSAKPTPPCDMHHVREVENLLATASEHDSRLSMRESIGLADVLDAARDYCRAHEFSRHYSEAEILSGCRRYAAGEAASWEGAL